MNHRKFPEKLDWFLHDRFGLFIHWGLYTIPSRCEWVRSYERMTVEEYQTYFDEFNPTEYDPRTWAKAAKEAGMKYAVLTAKHHDGFCLFDSALTDYKSTNTPCHRDLVREYVEAFREEGLKVGLYYSLVDWHHPDYPHYGDLVHPMRDNEAFKNHPHNFDNYLSYLHGQVEELCRDYGKIDIMWFDFSYEDLRCEAWHATELVRMIRSYQPHILINSRLEVGCDDGYGSIATDSPTEYAGDFVNPEQIIPPVRPVDLRGNPLPWESCITMNSSWGYCATDQRFKSPDMLIKKLVECVSKGGNLLLNVGPDPHGLIPDESLAILREIGRWMKRNGASIYGCGAADIAKPEYGRITQNDKKLYYHVYEPQVNFVPLPGVNADEIRKIRLLQDGTELRIQTEGFAKTYPEIVFITFGPQPELPNPTDTVIEVELK